MASDAIDRLQGLRSGVAVKTPARAVSTSNIALSGEQTVDGVALVAGDRVLVVGQSSAVGNGVYDVSTGAWTRSLDFDGAGDLTGGTMLLVLEGTSYGATMWRLDAAGAPDEDDLTFSSGVWVADGAIGTAELAALCVTTAKLAAEAVTAAKLATDAVETAKIKDANVTAAKLATDAVETAKIKDDNVTVAKISFGPVQRVEASTATFVTTSATVPKDDTIPQNTEGYEFLTAAITPLYADSILVVEVFAGVTKTNSEAVWALFKDSGADALAAKVVSGSLYPPGGLVLMHQEAAGSTSARTYKIRGGPVAAGTLDINGAGARLMGGVSAFRMVITEWKA